MSKRQQKWVALLAANLLLIVVVFYNGHSLAEKASQAAPKREEHIPAADVRVTTVTSASFAPTVEGFGAAQPRFSLTLAAQVSGQVLRLADNFESGRTFKEGEPLLELEDSDYRAALASAENDLAAAQVALLEEQREADQARNEWQSSGLEGEPDSALVLHKPQLESAKAAVTNAAAAVASARRDLQQTTIAAPFDSMIVSRNVSPGSYLQSGDEVAQLYSTDRVEIELPLSQRDWRNLPDLATLDQGSWPVTLTSVETGVQWQGHIHRAQLHVDDSSRQRSLIAVVDQPLDQSPPLAPGTFVRADIPGREIDQLWRLPPSSLSQRGEIWYVNDGVLKKFAAEVMASDDKAIYIQPPQSLLDRNVHVLTHPLSSYLPGMSVNAVEVNGE